MKKSILKYCTVVIFGMTLLIAPQYSTITVLADETIKESNIKVDAKASFLMEMNTSKVIHSDNGDTPLPIASVSKIITMYMVLEKIHTENIPWDTIIPVDDYLINLSKNYMLGSYVLEKGKEYTLRDLFDAMVIVSSNSSTMALGNWVAPDGKQDTYIEMANEKLMSWGITDATFISASGLENVDIKGYWYKGTNEENYNAISAKDVAIIAQHLITDYPEILETSSKRTKKLMNGTTITGGSSVIKGGSQYDSTLDIDGLKTGFTYLAGYCYVGTAEKDGMRMISVVLDSPDYGKATNQLLKVGLNNYKKVEVELTENVPEKLKKDIKEKDVSLVVPKKVTKEEIKVKEEKVKGETPYDNDKFMYVIETPWDDLGYTDNSDKKLIVEDKKDSLQEQEKKNKIEIITSPKEYVAPDSKKSKNIVEKATYFINSLFN